MKPCPKNRKRLAWLAARSLEADSALELHAHLATCPGCRQYLAEISAVTATLSTATIVPPIQVSESFHRRVTAALRAEPSRFDWQTLVALLHRTLWNWRLALPVAGGIIVLILAWPGSPRHRGTSPPASSAVQVASTPHPKADLAPSIANYRMVANRSLDEFDELLTRQGNRSQPRTPNYTASVLALVTSPD